MINRKFKISRKEPAKNIKDMSESELCRMRDYATMMANAAGYADDPQMQNRWISVEIECKLYLQGMKK